MGFPLRLSTMLLLSLTPLLTGESANVIEEIKVYQTSGLEVVDGDKAIIQCCWTTINPQIFTVNWIKNEVTVYDQRGPFRYDTEACVGLVFPSNKSTCICTNLTLHNINHNHTGLYVCTVTRDIPYYKRSSGEGTMITVTNVTQQQTADKSRPLYVVALPAIVMTAMLLVALMVFLRLRRRKGLDRAARVIYQPPHRDSGVDGTSTSSSKGSTHWCQVPVYEPFRYFLPVAESKGSD